MNGPTRVLLTGTGGGSVGYHVFRAPVVDGTEISSSRHRHSRVPFRLYQADKAIPCRVLTRPITSLQSWRSKPGEQSGGSRKVAILNNEMNKLEPRNLSGVALSHPVSRCS